MNAPRFSLVIPAFNEEKFLPRLLDTVDRARASYRAGGDAVEVIVADNSSTDSTSRIAFDRGCRVVLVEKRAIAAARNGGARVARGEVLAFIDADSQIDAQTFNEIDRILAEGDIIGGATGVRFERWSAGIASTSALLFCIASLFRVGRAYAGVVFCRRSDFDAIGGYNEARLFAEDVQLLLDLRQLGRQRGQHLVRETNARAILCTRKFDKHGDWHYFMMPVRLMWGLLFRGNDFPRRYWYEDR